MKLFRLLLLIVIVNATGTLSAQDIHYSLYNMSPLTLNPALTGAFSGTARIGGIYRDQWSSIIGSNKFVTPSFYIDAPIFRGFGKKDWVGVGFTTFTDKAGSLSLQTAASLLSASYHLSLNKKGSSILTLGLQGGNIQRRAKMINEFVFEDEFDVSLGGGGLGVNGSMDKADGKASYLDFTLGLMLRTKLDDVSAMELGVSYGHLTKPDYALTVGGATGGANAGKRPARVTAHGRYDRKINDKWSIAPTFLYQTTASANEFALQGWAGDQINKDFKLNMGLGYRFGDAAQVLFGGDYKDLRVALAYDVNVSSLNPASNYQGGFELAAWYIIKIYRKPTIKTKILCPRF